MRTAVISAGTALQKHLTKSERSIDEGLIANALLTAELLQARLTLNLGANVERETVNEAYSIMSALFVQRERMIAMHERLSGISAKLGIDPSSFGDGGDKGDLRPERPVIPELRVAA